MIHKALGFFSSRLNPGAGFFGLFFYRLRRAHITIHIRHRDFPRTSFAFVFVIADDVKGYLFLGPLERHLCIHAAHHERVSLANSFSKSGLTSRVLSARVLDPLIEVACSRSCMQQRHHKDNDIALWAFLNGVTCARGAFAIALIRIVPSG